jgi:hypothetical protein
MENWDENFNSEWKKAFDGAEVPPSSKVWGNIDAQLLTRENASMKKRVIFYQRLAAASVGVMFLVSGYAFWGGIESQNTIATNTETKTGAVESKSNTAENTIPTTTDSNTTDSNIDPAKTTNYNQNSQATIDNGDSASPVKTHYLNPATPIAVNSDKSQESSAVIAKTETLSRPFTDDLNIAFGPRKLNPPMPKRAKPNDLTIAYRIADARPAIITRKRKDAPEQNTWASLGFAAGNFTNAASNLDLAFADANSTQGLKSLATTSNTVKTEKTKPGSAFTMSLSGGKRLSKRWLLQGGLSYLNQSSSSNTSTVEVAPANEFTGTTMGAAYGPENTNSVTYTTESEIKSTFQFISVPMQAGFLLLDRKFGVQVNGGFSPDVFLRSALNDKATGTESVTTTGSGSTFKALSISGIGGLEFSYGFSEHYRISLTPGIRYALTPVYKENVLASAKPFMADIGLKFRYVFN